MVEGRQEPARTAHRRAMMGDGGDAAREPSRHEDPHRTAPRRSGGVPVGTAQKAGAQQRGRPQPKSMQGGGGLILSRPACSLRSPLRAPPSTGLRRASGTAEPRKSRSCLPWPRSPVARCGGGAAGLAGAAFMARPKRGGFRGRARCGGGSDSRAPSVGRRVW